MHELGLCDSVLDAVERRAEGRPVARVRLQVGVLHRVVPEAFNQAFALVSAGTIADGAAVDLVSVPVRTACTTCGAENDAVDEPLACPGCGSIDVTWTGGDQLVLESLEYRPCA